MSEEIPLGLALSAIFDSQLDSIDYLYGIINPCRGGHALAAEYSSADIHIKIANLLLKEVEREYPADDVPSYAGIDARLATALRSYIEEMGAHDGKIDA